MHRVTCWHCSLFPSNQIDNNNNNNNREKYKTVTVIQKCRWQPNIVPENEPLGKQKLTLALALTLTDSTEMLAKGSPSLTLTLPNR